MTKYKAIIFDYDGTLKLANQKRITNSIRSILTQLKEQGFIIFLATGRPHNHCDYLLDEGLVDCIISANGALIANHSTIIDSYNYSTNNIKMIEDFCKDKQIPCTFYTDELLYNGVQNSNLELGLKESMSLQINQLERYNHSVVTQVHLICLFCLTETDIELNNHFSTLKVSRWHPTIVSLLEKDITKMTGILKALSYYNLTISDCIAIGDGSNDIEMINESGLGIAVGFNNQKLISVADLVIPEVDESLLEICAQKRISSSS
ncbi:HAD-IIB family hydrolase [Vagococcus carniphilus]|uniref:HAD-IIB family hydrolase n=1 Tax=Vagococcus carniphilus TaxID=218144 RepID=UPI003B5BC4D2